MTFGGTSIVLGLRKPAMKDNPILNLTFDFAIEVVRYCELLEARRKFVIGNQLLKSGTSIGANVREAQNPHSRADFKAKMVIAMKEADETEYWLTICRAMPSYPECDYLIDKIDIIKKILGKIITTSAKG